MHDRDKLGSEVRLNIMSEMFHSRCDGVLGDESYVNVDPKVFYQKVGLIKGLEMATIVEVVLKWYCHVQVCDSGDKSGMLSF